MGSDTVILERRFVPEGTLVLRQGEDGNCAYLIQSGQVSVYSENDGMKVELAKLGAGEIFGEMALFFDEKRVATVKALEDTNLIVITRNTLKKKLEKSDPTVKAIVKMLNERIVTANNVVIQKKSDLDDLKETTRIIYQNVLTSMPRTQQRTFQNAVLPKLDEFLNAIQAFEDRFED